MQRFYASGCFDPQNADGAAWPSFDSQILDFWRKEFSCATLNLHDRKNAGANDFSCAAKIMEEKSLPSRA
jgi:hypothetical protein